MPRLRDAVIGLPVRVDRTRLGFVAELFGLPLERWRHRFLGFGLSRRKALRELDRDLARYRREHKDDGE